MGRRTLTAPPLGVVLEETKTTRTMPVGKSLADKLEAAFQHKRSMSIEHYFEIAYGVEEVEAVGIFDVGPNGAIGGRREKITKNEVDPQNIQSYVYETHGAGR